MISRRRFLGSSAAAMVVEPRAGATASGEQRGGRPNRQAGPLPPSIAALTSMRDQARPITNDERRARIERARQLMAQSKIDALMLAGGTSMSYFANMRWGGSERLFAVRHSGQRRSRSSSVRRSSSIARRSRSRSGPFGGGTADIRTWQEDESPFVRVAEGLKDRGIATGTARRRRDGRSSCSPTASPTPRRS